MRWALLACVGLLSACTGERQEEDKTCGDATETQVGVVTKLRFSRRDKQNRTVGFDLDGVVSDGTDPQGCGHADLVSPEGVEGIDSAFSALMPILETTEAAAVEGLIQDSIDSGRLLMLVELSRIDDDVDDSCLDAALWRGDGEALLATDGSLLDSQTFHRHPRYAPGLAAGASLVDGRIEGGSRFDLRLELQILDVLVDLTLKETALQVDLREDGTMSGVIGGALPTKQLDPITSLNDIDVGDLIESLVGQAADIYPDETGQCTALSVVLEFEAVPAFIYD